MFWWSVGSAQSGAPHCSSAEKQRKLWRGWRRAAIGRRCSNSMRDLERLVLALSKVTRERTADVILRIYAVSWMQALVRMTSRVVWCKITLNFAAKEANWGRRRKDETSCGLIYLSAQTTLWSACDWHRGDTCVSIMMSSSCRTNDVIAPRCSPLDSKTSPMNQI